MPRQPAESFSSGIAYTFAFEDFLAARRALAWNGVFGRNTYWIRYVIFAVIILAFWGLVTRNGLKVYKLSDLQTTAIFLACVVALMIVGWALDLLDARLAFRRRAIAGAEMSIRFEGDGVHCNTPSSFGVLSWSGVRRVLTPPGYLILTISKSEAMILPRRAFASDGAFGEAIRFVRTKTSAEATL